MTPSQGIEKFKETVEPVLGVVKVIRIVTGKGKHSKDGKSWLKHNLKEFILSKTKYCCGEDAENAGILEVRKLN